MIGATLTATSLFGDKVACKVVDRHEMGCVIDFEGVFFKAEIWDAGQGEFISPFGPMSPVHCFRA